MGHLVRPVPGRIAAAPKILRKGEGPFRYPGAYVHYGRRPRTCGALPEGKELHVPSAAGLFDGRAERLWLSTELGRRSARNHAVEAGWLRRCELRRFRKGHAGAAGIREGQPVARAKKLPRSDFPACRRDLLERALSTRK